MTISIAICLKSLSMPGNTIISHPFNFPFSTRGYFRGILLYCQNTNINRVHNTGIIAYFVLCTLWMIKSDSESVPSWVEAAYERFSVLPWHNNQNHILKKEDEYFFFQYRGLNFYRLWNSFLFLPFFFFLKSLAEGITSHLHHAKLWGCDCSVLQNIFLGKKEVGLSHMILLVIWEIFWSIQIYKEISKNNGAVLMKTDKS